MANKGYALLKSDTSSPTGFPQWYKVTKTFTDLAAASTTKSLSIYTLPSFGIVQTVVIYPRIPFTGGGTTTATMSIGRSGVLDSYMTAKDVFSTGTTVGNSPATSFTSTDVSIELTTSGDTNLLTAGEADIYLLITIME